MVPSLEGDVPLFEHSRGLVGMISLVLGELWEEVSLRELGAPPWDEHCSTEEVVCFLHG